ncbi:MAG: hypothetical protein ACTS3F_13870 [Phycisphaerales bacterium]
MIEVTQSGRRWSVVGGAALCFGALVLSGCSGAGGRTGEDTGLTRVERVAALGFAVEHMGEIDRFVWFGPESGPNLLHTENLGVPVPAGGSDEYTFRGGCYTWVSPQSGWVGGDGSARNWPPDPAMDRGPAWVVGRTADSITTLTPVSRLGLRERKTFTLREYGGTLEFVIENAGVRAMEAGAWVNTGVARHDRIALWMPEGTTLRGWDDEAVGKIESILGPRSPGGWRMLDLPRAGWEGGTKVWVEAPEGAARIGVWRHGRWLVRTLEPGDPEGTLRAVGEGPVAVYVDPTAGLIEAELYGPVMTIPAGGASGVTERWEVLDGRFPRPAASDLDRRG